MERPSLLNTEARSVCSPSVDSIVFGFNEASSCVGGVPGGAIYPRVDIGRGLALVDGPAEAALARVLILQRSRNSANHGGTDGSQPERVQRVHLGPEEEEGPAV